MPDLKVTHSASKSTRLLALNPAFEQTTPDLSGVTASKQASPPTRLMARRPPGPLRGGVGTDGGTRTPIELSGVSAVSGKPRRAPILARRRQSLHESSHLQSRRMAIASATSISFILTLIILILLAPSTSKRDIGSSTYNASRSVASSGALVRVWNSRRVIRGRTPSTTDRSGVASPTARRMSIVWQCDKGPSIFDVRNNITVDAVYDLPFGPGNLP